MRRTRRLVAERSDGLCEMCGTTATNVHHRKNRSQGGDWSPSNLMTLCGSGVLGCHGRVTEHPEWARQFGWVVPAWCDPFEVPVRTYRHGWVHLSDTGIYVPTEHHSGGPTCPA